VLEIVAVERCPRCLARHRYNVEVVRSPVTGQADVEEVTPAFRTRVFRCPATETPFQHRFELSQSSHGRIVEVRVVEGEAADCETDNPQDFTSEAGMDPFIEERRARYRPWNRKDLHSADILPGVHSVGTLDDADKLSGFVDEQLRILERYAEHNLRHAHRDRARFWAFKLPALTCAAGTTAFATLHVTSATIILGGIATICIGVDGVWPGGMLHNTHLRAAREVRRLQHEILTEWRRAQVQSGNSPADLRSAVGRILSMVGKERQRIDSYVTDAETSLGRDSTR
jgi:hypothetical protein